MTAVHLGYSEYARSVGVGYGKSPEIFEHCREIVSEWLGHAVYLTTTAADRMSETISSVDGLSALVRVATSASHALATVSERFSTGSAQHVRFSQPEFDALVGGTSVLADPAYFLCGDAGEDIQKGRYFWVVGKLCSTIVNIQRFAAWMQSYGRNGLNNACEAISQTRALRWARVVSITTLVGILSIGASSFKCLERILDYQKGYQPALAIVDGCAQASEIALSVSELLPICGPLMISILALVSAGLGMASYLTDISMNPPKEKDTVKSEYSN